MMRTMNCCRHVHVVAVRRISYVHQYQLSWFFDLYFLCWLVLTMIAHGEQYAWALLLSWLMLRCGWWSRHTGVGRIVAKQRREHTSKAALIFLFVSASLHAVVWSRQATRNTSQTLPFSSATLYLEPKGVCKTCILFNLNINGLFLIKTKWKFT